MTEANDLPGEAAERQSRDARERANDALVSDNVVWQAADFTHETRARVTGLCGGTVWLTGLPAAGKSTIARAIERELLSRGNLAYVLDGDNLRHGLTGDLGFTPKDRVENVRRVAHVARILSDAGVVALVALISPYAADRSAARDLHEQAGHQFLEVWVDTPLAICERRDPKGLYRRARLGELAGLTGVGAPYEPPVDADLRLESQSVRRAVDAVVSALEDAGVVGPATELRGLTLREREILGLIALGLTNKEIARRLSIQLGTVKSHVHHILDKVQADRRGKAVALVRTETQGSAEPDWSG